MILVFQRDIREMRSGTAFHIMLLITAALVITASAGISIALRLQAWYGAPESEPLLHLFMGLVVYFLPLIILLAFIWGFTGLPVIKEKVNGNIECLLATPMDPRSLWLGKSLAIFLPAYLLSVAGCAVIWLVINLAVVLPGWQTVVLPAPALLVGMIINPLLFFALLAFIILFSLAVNPDSATAPSFILGFGLMISIPVGLLTGAFDVNSWVFAGWYLSGAIAAWVIVVFLTRLLKNQTIVLSAKGG